MGHGGRFRQDAGMQGSLLSCVFHFSSDCLSSHIARGVLNFQFLASVQRVLDSQVCRT